MGRTLTKAEREFLESLTREQIDCLGHVLKRIRQIVWSVLDGPQLLMLATILAESEADEVRRHIAGLPCMNEDDR